MELLFHSFIFTYEYVVINSGSLRYNKKNLLKWRKEEH